MRIFGTGRMRVGLSDKLDGNMKVFSEDEYASVVENRQRFLATMGLGMESTYFVRIDYEEEDFCQFMMVRDENALRLDRAAGRCDGLLTTRPDVGLFLPLADCLGVVLYDAKNGALMVVHCGRQTILQEGAYKAVRYMNEKVGTKPEGLVAWLSPSAGKENYPLYARDGMSMQEAVLEQLQRAGVRAERIQKSEVDTTLDDSYFSHSQGDKQDRFAIVAVIDESDAK